MKAVTLTFAIFVLTLTIIISNALYIEKTVGHYIDSIQTMDLLPHDQRLSKLHILEKRWNKEKNIIQTSVCHTKIDTVSDLLSSLIVYEEYRNPQECQRTAKLLCSALEELRLLEELSITNIF